MNRTLRSLLVLSLALAPCGLHAQVFGAPSYSATQVFLDAINSGSTAHHSVGIAFDGSYYWAATGGTSGGTTLAQYDAAGALVTTYTPGIDFRSIYSDALGNVYARALASNDILRMDSPGSFSTFLTLTGGSPDPQSSVVRTDAGEFVAMNEGTVSRWDAAGVFEGSVALSGWGAVSGETDYPANRGIASLGGYWLTYSNGTLSAWDGAGNRVGQTILTGAGNTFGSNLSLSATNGVVWVTEQDDGGSWRGYSVGLTSVPEPTSAVLLLTGLLGVAAVGLRRRRSRELSA